jgi:signal transduction histidine kinase
MATMDSASEKKFFHLIEKIEHLVKLQSVQAEQLAEEALEIAEKCHQPEWQAEALYQLASYNSKVTSNFKLSNEYCEKSLRLANHGKNILLHAKVLRLMGMNEHYLGVWENAQQHYHDAVQLLESQPTINGTLKEELGYLYYYISVLNKSSEIKDYPLTCLRKAIDIFEKINNKEGLARCYNMFANHLNEVKKHNEALHYHLKALELFEELNETFFAAVVQNNAGYSYCELGDFEKGFELLHQALETKLKFGNPSSIANSYIHLGMAHKLKNNLQQAIEFFHKAESILKELNSKSDLNTVYDFLSEVYAATGDFKKAYEYHILYDKTKDEMFNFDKAAAIMDAKSRFELEKKKKEAEMLRQKNIEIENYAHQLEISNNELKQFAHVASHDLKEPLRMISNYIHLLEKKVESTSNDNIKTYMGYVKEGAKRMYSLINSLLEFSNLNHQIQPEKVDLNELLIEIRNQFAEQMKNVVVSIDNLPTLVADKLHLYRLFENLISNALKFNLSTKKILKIQYNDTDRTHEFKVVDNGIGIAREYADKVFIIFQRLNARDQFPGTGIGLAICKKIVENLKGKIWVEDNEFGGSTFCISIPKEAVQ